MTAAGVVAEESSAGRDGVLDRDDFSSRFSLLAARDGGALVLLRTSSCITNTHTVGSKGFFS